MIILVNPLAC